MNNSRRNNETLHFTVIMIALFTMSVAGIASGASPQTISWAEGSTVLSWSIIAIGSFILFDIVNLILTFQPDTPIIADEITTSDIIRSKGRGRFIKSTMIPILKPTLCIQPLVFLFAGRILGWDAGHIVGVVSVLVFLGICYAFFFALKQWGLNEKHFKRQVSDRPSAV